MPICTISPSDKRAQAKVVGEDLVRHYGKKKYYTVQEVKDANRSSGVQVAFAAGLAQCTTRMLTSMTTTVLSERPATILR